METYRRLTRRDRYQIEKYLALNKSKKWIADKLGFHRSTIYREVKIGTLTVGVKDCTPRGNYSALKAHREFLSIFHHARRGFDYRGRIIKNWVEDQIIIKLHEGWSPEQISRRLRMEKKIKISPEGIYKYILSEKRRGRELHKCLRQYRRRRRRFKRRNRYWEMQERRRRSIDVRPDAANDRSQIGHWERDLMLGRRGSGAILALIDRKSQMLLLEKLKDTTSEETSRKTVKAFANSKYKCRSLTNDNGHEFGEFWKLEKKIKSKIYFTHALCPWERGSVENVIGLIRQFIPKGSNIKKVSAEEVRLLQQNLNSRPRRGLGFKTPIEFTTKKKQKLITQKRLESPPPEYYEQFYLTAEEIEQRRKLRGETVALSG